MQIYMGYLGGGKTGAGNAAIDIDPLRKTISISGFVKLPF